VTDDAKPAGITTFELTANTCKWRLDVGKNSRPPYVFCGKPTARPGEKPYCEEHSKIAYQGLNTPEAYRDWLAGKYVAGRATKRR
jgi:hypothetical protein